MLKGVLTIGVEMDDTSHTVPNTIWFGSLSGYNYITDCTGFIDFSAYKPFSPSNNTGQFVLAGPVFGDEALYAQPSLGSSELGQAVRADGQTLSTQGVSILRAQPGRQSLARLILAPGRYSGQQVIVINEGTGRLTFGTAGTSNVADGTRDTIGATAARAFVWDASTKAWYRLS
jgi:hypothetical protein